MDYIVEYSPKQNMMHYEPVRRWTRRQLAALFNTGEPRGDGSWQVVGIVPADQAASYAAAFFERYHREAKQRELKKRKEQEQLR